MMPTWLDETRRQNSTNFSCGGMFSIFRVKFVSVKFGFLRKGYKNYDGVNDVYLFKTIKFKFSLFYTE
jgi:hypothetical protein